MRLRRHAPVFISLALLLYFWAAGVAQLDRFPPVYEDESWIAAPGYTFWTRGVFGADLFAGFYGMERHFYAGMPPLYPLLVGAALRLFGVGLFQARIVSVMLAALTLALTHRLGARLFSSWQGTLAVAVLVGWRIAAPQPYLPTGIPMNDVARIVRFDVAVPVFGLSAFILLADTLQKRTRLSSRAFGVRCLVGLATLSHLYGAFWLSVLSLAALWTLRRKIIRPALLMGAGWLLAMLPLLVFIASGWEDFTNQNRSYADRLDVSAAQFYLNSLAGELDRYRYVRDAIPLFPETRLWLAALALGAVWLAYQSIFRRQASSRLLLTALVSLPLPFGIFILSKNYSYLATLWSIYALVIAGVFANSIRSARKAPVRWLVALVFLLPLISGIVSTAQIHGRTQAVTPYRVLTQHIADALPPDSHVLALQHYWLGLFERTAGYRTLLVPIYWTNPRYVATPIPFGEAAQAIPAQIMILDETMLRFLADQQDPTAPYHALASQIRAYLDERQARLLAQIHDPTYGRIEVYQLVANVSG